MKQQVMISIQSYIALNSYATAEAVDRSAIRRGLYRRKAADPRWVGIECRHTPANINILIFHYFAQVSNRVSANPKVAVEIPRFFSAWIDEQYLSVDIREPFLLS